MNKEESFDSAKKEEILAVNQRISEDIESRIRELRYGKLNPQVDLNDFYFG